MKIEELIKSNKPLDIEKSVVLNILFTQNCIADKFNEILKPYELSSEQYNVLRILRGQNGKAVNMCLLQERMIAKTSNTTRLVDKLLLKSLVTREICPSNRRKMEIEITQKGLNVLTELEPKVRNQEVSLAQNITNEELITLNNLLEKYRN